jgi:hypothetical protein
LEGGLLRLRERPRLGVREQDVLIAAAAALLVLEGLDDQLARGQQVLELAEEGGLDRLARI